jgi:sigma-B regulation protein RsbU (phosphoserine phosphatase)
MPLDASTRPTPFDRERLEYELAVARRVMASLLPHETPVLDGFDIAAANRPSHEVGGDYYEFIPLGDGRWGIATADVVGKGLPAALLVAATRASLCTLAGLELAQRAILRRANAFLHASVEPGRFVTLFYGVMEVRARRLIYVNAGHMPPILLRREGRVELLEEGGPPLGLLADARYLEGFAQLRSGDLLALYSDGVSDAMDPAERPYGRDRLAELLARSAAAPASAICEAVLADVARFSQGRAVDDQTIVIVRAL